MHAMYGHQMEQRHYSARNLSDASEGGSQHELQSGFFMTSFTATIFFASLVTLGVLLIALLITLAIMLQSCQSKKAGVIDLLNRNNYYSYCKMNSLLVELNNLEGYNLPSICRDLAIHYIKGGQYARDLDLTMSVIDDYFDGFRPSDDGLDAVLMDIDDIFPTNPHSSNLFPRFLGDSISNSIEEAKIIKLMFVLRLYINLQTSGWSIILLSREPVTQRNVTIDQLVAAGFRGWSSLIMREDYAKGNEHFTRLRNVIQKKGFRIKSFISSHMDVLNADMRIFLLPGPSLFDKFEQQIESKDTGHYSH